MRFISILIILISHCALGQVQLKSNGEIPKELYVSTVDKYNSKKQLTLDSSYHEPRSVRLSRVGFYESSYFFIDAIKNNAGILINDDYTKLLNKIADDLLKDKPALRQKFNVYAYRAPYVNAFSTDQGDLFFTLGLLAHVENEAQLAFVVGHEIMHFIKQHNTSNLNEKIKIYRGQGEYKDMDLDQSTEEVHSFSRELERQADELSLQYYLKSKYKPSEVLSALEMLETSHLGFSNGKFNYSTIAGNSWRIPSSLLPDSIPPLKIETATDPHSTHPNIRSRIKYCTTLIDQSKSKGDLEYQFISEKDFKELRNLARLEQILLLYEDHYYARAIYNANLLYSENKDPYLIEFIQQCLEASIQVANSGFVSSEKRNKDYSGEVYRVHHLLYKLKKYETAGLNFIFNWHRYLNKPNEQNKTNTESALLAFISSAQRDWKKYQNSDFDTTEIRTKKLDELLPKIKIIFDSEIFKREFGTTNDYYTEFKDREASASNNLSDQFQQRTNLEKVIVINPYYMRYDPTVQGYVDLVQSYENEGKLLSSLQDVAMHNNIDMSLLDVRAIEPSQSEAFDEIATLSNYVNRLMVYKLNKKIEVLPSSQERLDGIIEKYGTSKVMWIGVRSYKGTSFSNMSKLLLNFISLSVLPYTLLSTFEKDHEVEMFYVLFDIKTNKIVKTDYLEYQFTKDNKSNITLYLNEFFRDL